MKSSLALIAILILSMVFVLKTNEAAQALRAACTEEAKVCPDGSSVGRTGPHCEFAACPGEETAKPVTCPITEVKPCPDGSYVAPQGPDCTFPACPGEEKSDSVKANPDDDSDDSSDCEDKDGCD